MNENTINSKSTINQDVEITGNLEFKGELFFDGKLEKGSITGSKLVIGEHAGVKGDVMADAVTLSGKVTGNVTAMDKCELGASAELTGDLVTSRLSMEEGATLLGQVRLGPNAEKFKSAAKENKDKPQSRPNAA